MNVMVDIETLGADDNAVVLSIGAAAFNLRGIKDEFLVNIDIKDSIERNRVINGKTLEWWLKQEDAAIKSLFIPEPMTHVSALFAFKEFINNKNADKIWANGVNFDIKILDNCYKSINSDLPWQYRQICCMRSIRDLGGAINFPYKAFKESHNTNIHNALEDAKCQALYVIEVYKMCKNIVGGV